MHCYYFFAKDWKGCDDDKDVKIEMTVRMWRFAMNLKVK